MYISCEVLIAKFRVNVDTTDTYILCRECRTTNVVVSVVIVFFRKYTA